VKIGDLSLKNNVFLAPMAGVSNLPFRIVARGFGCGLAFTEMVSANGLVRGMEKSRRYLDSSEQDRPLGVQIFGREPDVLADAARIVTAAGADLIDINLGCPVKNVGRAGAGAALMKDPRRVEEIVKAVRKATSLPLTVKMRSGWNSRAVNALEIARIAEDCGSDAVIMHPRTAEQGFGGTADWRGIASLKELLRIPVVGSGDIRCSDDALRMLETTGCDAVMVGRGSLGNPWIFGAIISSLQGEPFFPPALTEREALIREHLKMETAYTGEGHGSRNFRKHLLWYTKGLRNGARFRQIVGAFNGQEAMLEELRRFFLSLAEEREG
jgi:tRNA-dihydrouridine synthase B